MSKARIFTFILLCCMSCSRSTKKQQEANEQFSKDLLALKAYFQIPGLSVLVKRGDQVLYEDYLGMAHLGSQTPMDSTTGIPMASLTKMFSALLLLQLEEEGKLALHEPIRAYIDDAHVADSIKIEHALSHTSQGMPGKNFYYNNTRFMWLQRVIEEAGEKDFKTQITEKIIAPLKLQNTYLLEDSLQLAQTNRKLAQPYFLGGEPKNGYVEKTSRPGFIDYGYSAAAGITSTVRDLGLLSSALDKGLLLSSSSKNKMFTPYAPDLPYGLGIFTQQFMEEQLIWGYGQYDCYSSLFLKVPGKDLTLVLAANNNLMSDPARLIAGDLSYSLFALSFLKNYVFDLQEIPLFEHPDILASLEQRLNPVNMEFYRKKLLAQALAASFMNRYNDSEGAFSKKLLGQVFDRFPDYETYGDLVLLRNLYMLKFMDAHRKKKEFTAFDEQIEQIGQKLLTADKNNPYANYYMANFHDFKGQADLTEVYYQQLLDANNFSPWWYTAEAKQWMHKRQEVFQN
ncbi:serine hydrolase [Spongiimicrobium sp. 2-473A-2-J]|uniref:serine hydrolase n=1 Tax=Eudoraea algarum TaxID=3417568 RepID=UPI003D35C52F